MKGWNASSDSDGMGCSFSDAATGSESSRFGSRSGPCLEDFGVVPLTQNASVVRPCIRSPRLVVLPFASCVFVLFRVSGRARPCANTRLGWRTPNGAFSYTRGLIAPMRPSFSPSTDSK